MLLNPGGINDGDSADDFVEGAGDGAVVSFMKCSPVQNEFEGRKKKGRKSCAPEKNLLAFTWPFWGPSCRPSCLFSS